GDGRRCGGGGVRHRGKRLGKDDARPRLPRARPCPRTRRAGGGSALPCGARHPRHRAPLSGALRPRPCAARGARGAPGLGPPEAATGAVVVPIFPTSTFAQEAVGKNKGYEYARTGNPTRTALETCLAALEGGRWGLAFASGMAATDAVAHLLSKGDHVVMTDDVYGGTYRLFAKLFERLGVSLTAVDMRKPEAARRAIRPRTRLR